MSEPDELTIGQLASMSRLTIRALRHYDEIDLLTPARVDPSSGYRFYHPHHITKASTIAVLRGLGVSTTTISELLRNGADVQALIGAERERLEREANKALAALEVLTVFNPAQGSTSSAFVEDREPFVLLGAHSIVPAHDDIEVVGAAFEQLFSKLDAAGISYDPDGVCVIHRSDKDELALEFGVRSDEDVVLDGYRRLEIPGGRVVSSIHEGPLASLPLGHARLATWALDNGFRPDGPPTETYLGELSEQRTRIELPVAPEQ